MPCQYKNIMNCPLYKYKHWSIYLFSHLKSKDLFIIISWTKVNTRRLLIGQLPIGPRLLGFQWRTTTTKLRWKHQNIPPNLSTNFRPNVNNSIISVLPWKYLVKVRPVGRPYCTLLRQSAVVSVFTDITHLPACLGSQLHQSVELTGQSTPEARPGHFNPNTWTGIQSTPCCYSIWSSHRC